MTKDEAIELMHGHGFYENIEEIYDHGEIKYSVTWIRVRDDFHGPTVIDQSATQAFIDSAKQALGAIALHDLHTGKLS